MSTQTDATAFLNSLETAFAKSNTDFARAYYLFATAKLSDTYNSSEIYAKYPVLSEEQTFQALKTLYDQQPNHEEIKRLFTSVLGTYIGNQLSAESDEFQNLKNQLKIKVQDLGLLDPQGTPIQELLYEDVSEWLKKLVDAKTRQDLYQRMSQAYLNELTPRFIALFEKETQLMTDLGYPDLVEFYSHSSGHHLVKLGQKAKQLVTETETLYRARMAAFYKQRTGEDFSKATRADIAYVFSGKSAEMEAIDAQFPEETMVPLATKTFDGLGLDFSHIASTVDYKTLDAYDKDVVNTSKVDPRILLDISKREGKRSRAFVYPSKVPSEIYLSVKPEGGLDDYSAFFHESGHAQHFAYTAPQLSFSLALMGNNTVTESYAYLMQNLFLNRHWLEHQANLTPTQALQVVQRGALHDLYMLRRYGSKLQFELMLYNNPLNLTDARYAELLTHGTGFLYDAEGWSRDVDAGFYVADYFTAWALEAQLREYLATHYGKPEVHGEDWYTTPKAGEFLKGLWKQGNLTQDQLSEQLGYNDPTDVGPLLRLMKWNLGEST